MAFNDFLLPQKCGTCGLSLVRVPKPEGKDLIVCVTVSCRAVGDYEEVIHGQAGLKPGALTEEQCQEIIDDLRKL